MAAYPGLRQPRSCAPPVPLFQGPGPGRATVNPLALRRGHIYLSLAMHKHHGTSWPTPGMVDPYTVPIPGANRGQPSATIATPATTPSACAASWRSRACHARAATANCWRWGASPRNWRQPDSWIPTSRTLTIQPPGGQSDQHRGRSDGLGWICPSASPAIPAMPSTTWAPASSACRPMIR